MADDDFDDIDADIRSAMQEPAGEGVQAQASIPQPVETPTPVAATEPADGPARSPDGKFAKAPEAAQDAPSIDQPAPAVTEAATPIRPPAAWSAQAKADFATLPPHIQNEVVKREQDMDKGLASRAEQLKAFEPLTQVLEPYRQKMAVQGVTPAQAIQSLLAAQDMLETQPVQAIQYLARQYGVNLGQMAQAGQQAQPQLPPELQHLSQTVQTLQQQLAAQQRDAQQQQASVYQSQIDTFAGKPENLYFPDVKEEMALLLQAGKADTLESAYDMATWARPDIRALILKDQKAKEQAAVINAARDQAAKARNAAGSVTGSPSAGGTVVSAVNSNGSIEDDIRSAISSLSGRA